MAKKTVNFNLNPTQLALVVEAFEYDADKSDPSNAPHSFTETEVLGEVRKLMMRVFKARVASSLERKRDASLASPRNINEVT